uniref:Uncharacterized protein n=1 Tax=Siphoviridae sp. ctdmY20 TaxID=2825586 RepID=A0A8S5QBC5_9CAUD|nr:MAG TPA: hypothetical protein [Siphoviridae sp. ctdmY20]
MGSTLKIESVRQQYTKLIRGYNVNPLHKCRT